MTWYLCAGSRDKLGETRRWERGEEIEEAKDASMREPLWVHSRMSLRDILI